MSLFSRLGEKSWETPGAAHPDPASYRPEAAKIGLMVYLVVASFLFFLITSAYLMRMGVDTGHGAHGSTADWHPMPEPPLIWINTVVLMLASLAWEAARSLESQGRAAAVRRAFTGAGALGLLFLVGQLLLWRDYAAAGYFLESNPANSFFYLITALHGLHIGGGLFVWVRALLRRRAPLPIQLCAAYWHFLLLLWLAMLALLIST
jgi:cytochrome c oxidase subunit 3